MSDTITVYKIPLIAVSNQQLNCSLGGQNCTLNLYQRDDYLYLDLAIQSEWIRRGAICIPYTPLITGSTSFKGQIYCMDSISPVDAQQIPHYSKLGTRFNFFYVTADTQQALEDAKYQLSTS